MVAQKAAIPSFFTAESVSTGGFQAGEAARSMPRAERICEAAICAAVGSRSALLKTTRSASSMMPFLIACRSSPAFGSCSSTKQSVNPATAVSDWPTPTVSTMMMS
jgi:hypothetical protein